MKSADEELYLRNIEEFVYDEEKIVTYKWLSHVLNIHPNSSKQLLEKYVSQKRTAGEEVHVVYLVIGITSSFSATVRVVCDTDLEKFKKSLQKICSEHVYAVQKSSFPKDLSILYSANKVNTSGESENSLVIHCAAAVPRVVPKVIEPAQPAPTAGKEQKSSLPAKTPVETGKAKDKPVQKTKSNTGIAAFLNSGTSGKSKSASNKTEASQNCKKETLENKKTSDTIENVKPGIKEDSEKKENHDSDKTTTQNGVTKGKTAPKRSESTSSKTKSKTKKNSKGPPAKKHRRIIVESDSESEQDIFGDARDEEEEDEEAAEEKLCTQSLSPEEERTLPTNSDKSNENSKRGPARILKVVSKTYTDAEGYLLTKKEYVYEECEEGNNKEEEDGGKKENLQQNHTAQKVVSKTETKPPPKKKQKMSPQKTKQSTLMSFFKRA